MPPNLPWEALLALQVGGKPWWQAVLEVWGVVPVLLLAAAPHSYLAEALTVKVGLDYGPWVL